MNFSNKVQQERTLLLSFLCLADLCDVLCEVIQTTRSAGSTLSISRVKVV
jgi:hypothetical protein